MQVYALTNLTDREHTQKYQFFVGSLNPLDDFRLGFDLDELRNHIRI